MPPAARIFSPSSVPLVPLHASRTIASCIRPPAFSSSPPPSKTRSSVETTSDVSWPSVTGIGGAQACARCGCRRKAVS
eukprot:scaffold20935_cov69-Phaeocystis_antarctica.AAC.9